MNQDSRKNDTGKPRYDLILVDMVDEVEELVQLATKGALTYGDRSWQVATDPKAYLNAAYRHMAEDAKGIEFDPQDGIRHSIKVCWNMMAYTYLRSRLGAKGSLKTKAEALKSLIGKRFDFYISDSDFGEGVLEEIEDSLAKLQIDLNTYRIINVDYVYATPCTPS